MPAGEVLFLTFPHSVDDKPVGTTWRGHALQESPLAYMSRIPLIVKSDDYGAAVDAFTAQFMEIVAEHEGIVSTGIITATLGYDLDVLDTYTLWHKQGWELWFHGHTHLLGKEGVSEFENSGLDAQKYSLSRGLQRAQERLGIDLKAFGAPGNAIDNDTPHALSYAHMPVWLYGDKEHMAQVDDLTRVYPYQLSIEPKVGSLHTVEKGMELIGAFKMHEDPLILQVHPRQYNNQDIAHAEGMFAAIKNRGVYAYTTPYALYAWEKDRSKMVLTKTSDTTYTWDATDARYEHTVRYASQLPLATCSFK